MPRDGFARTGLGLLGALLLLCIPLAADAQESTAAATRQYNAAVGMQNSEDYALAAEMWEGFLSDFAADPRAARAWHYLGICQFKQNKLEPAVETFQKVIAGYPDFELLPDSYLNLGLAQYKIALAGKPEMYDAAADTLGTLVTRYPKDEHVAEAIYYHGECLYNRDKKEEAAAKYARLIQEYPEHAMIARAMLALGVARTDLGQHRAALAVYDEFLKRFPGHALAGETTMWRGESLYALGEYEEAIRSYTAAAESKGFAMADYATLRLGDALAAISRFAEAAAVYASVPAKFPESQYVGLCRLEAGKKHYAAGNFAEARPLLQQVVAAGGQSAPEAAHWIAQCLLKQDQPAGALAVVEEMLPRAGEGPQAASLMMDRADAMYELPDRRGESVAAYAAVAAGYPKDPLAPQALYMAAFAAMGQGAHPAALKYADAFLTDYPGHELDVGVMHVKAESSLLSNRYAEAEKLYEELLQRAPDDADAEIWKVHRGTAMYLQEKYQETIAALRPVAGRLSSPELAAEAWYRIGRSQAELGQYVAAAGSLESSLEAAPRWKRADDTHLVLAYVYQQSGDLDKARQHAGKVIAEFPDSPLLDMAHYRLAECARLGDELPTAVAEYRRIIDDWPESELLRHALSGLGSALLGQEDYAQAETTFSTLIDGYPDDPLIPRARYGRGVARQRLQQYAPAIEDIEAFLAAGPSPQQQSQARHVLGLCQKGLGNLDQAVASFRKLLKDDPAYADADDVYFELGWALKTLGREPDAAETFAELTRRFPSSSLAADSHYLVGDFHYRQKDYAKAIPAYRAAVNKAGETALGEQATYKLALAHFSQGDFVTARRWFAQQRETWPQGPLSSDATLMEAECLFNQEQHQEALALYEQVKEPSSEDAAALALLHAGIAAGKLEQWEKGLELLGRCIGEYPQSPYLDQAMYEQGWAEQNLGNLDEALARYAEVIARSELEPAARAQFMIGEIQFQRKQHEEAIKSFFKVSYGYGYPGWQADATYEAARCFEVLGRTAQALTQYQKLVDEFPQSDKVPQARQRIRELK